MLKDSNKAQEIYQLINSLTEDEDCRQSLWVYYLEGNPASAFPFHLEEIVASSESEKLQQTIWKLISSPSYAKIADVIEGFTEFEKSIIILLYLGLSVEVISGYKQIDEVRVRQTIQAIRNNSKWKTFRG